MGETFLIVVGNLQMLNRPLGKSPGAIPTQLEFGFHTADHYRIKLRAIGRDGTGKTLAVEQFQQGGKTLPITVMRRGREEQLVLEVGRKRANGEGTHGVGGVFASSRRRDVMGLVHD